MTTKIYLDDLRPMPERMGFTHLIRSYDDMIDYMQTNGCPDYISFDHDLGLECFDRLRKNSVNEKSGFEVAKWMVEMDMDSVSKFIPADFKYTVHSANPVGAANIVGLLDSYLRKRAEYFG